MMPHSVTRRAVLSLMLTGLTAATVPQALAQAPSALDTRTAAAKVAPLVDAKWLKARLNEPGIVILDVTSKRIYASGHVPGAIFSAFGRWRTRKGDVPGMLPPVDYLEKLVGSLGIGNEDHVVLVPAGWSAGDVGIATRIYWTLKTLGHEKVSILDGGLNAWLSDRRNPVQKASVSPEPKPFRARFTDAWLATAKDVETALAGGSPQLVDNRPVAQHTGIEKSGAVLRYGTIPGAINVPEDWLLHKGRFRPVAQLRRLHDLLGVKDGPVIHFCNTGHRASVGWFVRSELLGMKNSRLYDGSLAEWTRLPAETHPIEVKLDIHSAESRKAATK